MSQSLVGRVALVTGSGRSVGRTIAMELASRGAHIIVNYFHSRELAESTCDHLRAQGWKADLIRASVAKEEQVAGMFEQIRERHGRLDILVNNAAIGAFADFLTLSERDWRRIHDVNFHGARLCCAKALPMMMAQGSGVIINLSSPGSTHVLADYSAVGTSKAALESLTRYLAAEYGRYGIRANVAACGPIDGTAFRTFPDGESIIQAVNRLAPLGRTSAPEDLARTVAWLVSDDARWITGQTVMADGGLAALAPGQSKVFSEVPAGVPAPVFDSDAQAMDRDAAPVDGTQAAVERAESTANTDSSVGASSDEAIGEELEPVIAIVGMGLALPGASTPEQFWTLLQQHENVFSEPGRRFDIERFWSADPAAEDRNYSRRAGYLHDFQPKPLLQAEMNAGGLGPDDHCTRWLRHAVMQALEHVRFAATHRSLCVVGLTPEGNQHLDETLIVKNVVRQFPEDRTVYASLKRHYPHALDGPAEVLAHRIPSRAIKGILPADTEIVVIDTACSSSLYAVDLGAKALKVGDADMAVCGGAFVLSPRMLTLFAKVHGTSTSDEVRSFAADANGTIFADGAAVVVLKRYEQAIADGDEVWGIIAGMGTSSDGAGKAIHAPNTLGQQLAINRAFADAGMQPDDIDWIVAHSTGTPEGDRSEWAALHRVASPAHPWTVTSNKAIVGHTGWAAGAVSVIHALLGLRYGTIPAQPIFGSSQEAGVSESGLRIPRVAQTWPRQEQRARTAGVCSFGFGGTDAFLLVQEAPRKAPPMRRKRAPKQEPLVLIDWASHVPGELSRERIFDWLRGRAAAPAAKFGDYPLPDPLKVRLPPSTLKAIDRSQLMIMHCAQALMAGNADMVLQDADRVGVFLGHMGPTQAAADYNMRCHLPVLEAVLAPAQHAALAQQVRARVMPSNGDSLPGLMPNVTVARVAALLNLRGPNMAVEGARDAALCAFAVAALYLQAGEIDVALLFALNANTDPFLAETLGDPLKVAEGALGFILTRQSVAKACGKMALAELEVLHHAQAGELKEREADPFGFLGGRTMLAADSGWALLHALTRDGSCVLRCQDMTHRLAMRVTPAPDAASHVVAGELQRHVPVMRPAPAGKVRPRLAAKPQETLILTDSPELASAMNAREEGRVLLASAGITEPAYAALVGERPIRHIKVLVAGGASMLSRRTEALHEYCFLAMRHHREQLDAGGSFNMLLLSAFVGGTSKPHVGLFTGFAKCMLWDLPGCRTCVLVHETDQLELGMSAWSQETMLAREHAVTYCLEGKRLHLQWQPSPIAAAGDLQELRAKLGVHPVVLATGGARGITAEMLLALTARMPMRVWLIGSQPLPDIEALDSLSMGRAALIEQWREQQPGVSLAVWQNRFERLQNGARKLKVIETLRQSCGDDRLHYLECDIQDAGAVERAVQQVLDVDGHIDVLLHSAGVHRSGLKGHALDIYKTVRDVKVRGYLHLKQALADHPPSLWCNTGSIASHIGLPSDQDYVSANDFLSHAAAYARAVANSEEFTLSWPLWTEAGFAADPLLLDKLTRDGMASGISSAQGSGYFLQEIAKLPHREADCVYLGENERRTLEKVRAHARGGDHELCFIHDKPESATQGSWTIRIELDQHAYLLDHLVDGRPCLPGTVFLEIAVEAAKALAPDLTARALHDVVFSHFLRGPPSWWPAIITVNAKVVEATPALTMVQVCVESQAHTKNGERLGEPRRHADVTVELGMGLAVADTTWPAGRFDDIGRPVPDPYQWPAAPVSLRGAFQSIWNVREHEAGISAALDLSRAAKDDGLRRFLLPGVALDALARTRFMSLHQGKQTVSVFGGIGLVRLYMVGSDADLYERYGNALSVHHRLDSRQAQSFLLDPDGRVLADISGLGIIGRGEFDASRGGFLPPETSAVLPGAMHA